MAMRRFRVPTFPNMRIPVSVEPEDVDDSAKLSTFGAADEASDQAPLPSFPRTNEGVLDSEDLERYADVSTVCSASKGSFDELECTHIEDELSIPITHVPKRVVKLRSIDSASGSSSLNRDSVVFSPLPSSLGGESDATIRAVESIYSVASHSGVGSLPFEEAGQPCGEDRQDVLGHAQKLETTSSSEESKKSANVMSLPGIVRKDGKDISANEPAPRDGSASPTSGMLLEGNGISNAVTETNRSQGGYLSVSGSFLGVAAFILQTILIHMVSLVVALLFTLFGHARILITPPTVPHVKTAKQPTSSLHIEDSVPSSHETTRFLSIAEGCSSSTGDVNPTIDAAMLVAEENETRFKRTEDVSQTKRLDLRNDDTNLGILQESKRQVSAQNDGGSSGFESESSNVAARHCNKPASLNDEHLCATAQQRSRQISVPILHPVTEERLSSEDSTAGDHLHTSISPHAFKARDIYHDFDQVHMDLRHPESEIVLTSKTLSSAQSSGSKDRQGGAQNRNFSGEPRSRASTSNSHAEVPLGRPPRVSSELRKEMASKSSHDPVRRTKAIGEIKAATDSIWRAFNRSKYDQDVRFVSPNSAGKTLTSLADILVKEYNCVVAVRRNGAPKIRCEKTFSRTRALRIRATFHPLDSSSCTVHIARSRDDEFTVSRQDYDIFVTNLQSFFLCAGNPEKR